MNYITVKGQGNTSVEVILDSISSEDLTNRITTFRVVHPRCILAQLNKHRQLSNNYQSSRAVPLEKAIRDVWENPYIPYEWMRNQSGMQATKSLNKIRKTVARLAWIFGSKLACLGAALLDAIGLHKQWTNRLIEPYQYTTGIITATEYDNLFYLRRHSDTQPEFKELADCMWDALQKSDPQVLEPGEWHVPFIESEIVKSERHYYHPYYWGANSPFVFTQVKKLIDVETAKKFSSACIAQVSFRKLNTEETTLHRVYSRLVDGEQPHSVCMEHVATPIRSWSRDKFLNLPDVSSWEKGITHMTTDGELWSGNFKRWIQSRHLLENESCKYYDPQQSIRFNNV